MLNNFFGRTKVFLDVTKVVLVVILFLIAAFVILMTLLFFGRSKVLVVQSGSMSPTISLGSLALVFPKHQSPFLISPTEGAIKTPKFRIGDVVSFRLSENKSYVTHRIVSVKREDSNFIYQTKGDANKSPDFSQIKENEIEGKILFTIPFLGYLIGFAKTKAGLAFLIFLPALYVIVGEVVNIIRELRKKSLGNLTKGAIFVFPLFFILTAFITARGFAYFNDKEVSSGNNFQAAAIFASPTPTSTPTPSPTPTPITNHVVINEVDYKIDSAHTITSEANSEWFEIYNPTASSIVLTGWSITDNNSCDNFPGTISLAPNSFAIVTPLTEASFESVWSGVPASAIYITLSSAIGDGLANNDRLILKNNACSTGTIIDQISWGNDTAAFNPGIGIVADGHSSERNPDGIDTDTAADFVDRTTPTPGI